MTKLRYVVERGGWYEFRLTVPKDLQEHFGKTAITAPLKTKNELEAQKQADELAKEYKAQFKELRTPSEPAPPPKVQPDYVALQFGDEDLLKRNTEAYELFVADRINRLVPLFEYMKTGTVKVIDEYGETRIEELKSCLHTDADGLSANTLENIRIDYLEDGSSLLSVCNRVAGSNTPPNVVFLRKVARTVIPILISGYTQIRIDTMKAMNLNPTKHIDDDNLNKVEQPLQVAHRESKQPPTHLFSDVVEKNLAFKANKESHNKQFRSDVASFQEWTGDKPIAEYSTEDIVDYRDNCLRKLPKDWRKKYDVTNIRDAVKLGIEDRSSTTINNILRKVNTTFNYAVKNRWIDFNPASGVKVATPKVSKKKVSPFDDDELKKLFEILPYKASKPSWYWGVMISLHNSLRLSEICQLQTSDIQEIEGVPCFDITEEEDSVTEKSVKTYSSCRTVPIHPKLIEVGFLKFVEQRRKELKNKNDLLFSNITLSKQGDYYRTTSKWFNERFKKEFISAESKGKKNFHSLRHTFGRYAKNRAKMNPNAERVLMGHTSDKADKVHDAYTIEEIQFLLDELSKLDYGLTIPTNPFMK